MDTLDSSQCHYHVGGAMEFGAAFDPIHVLSSRNIPQRLEAATRLAADSVAAAKSGPGTEMDIPLPPSSNANFSTNNPLGVCGVMADFGPNGLILSNTVKTGNLQSLDSLLSATTRSYTDTLAEDDGIPMILSGDAERLWNIESENPVSSCESAIYAFNLKPIDANDNINIKVPVTELDETASHASSHIPQSYPITSSKSKSYTKRGRNRALLASDSSTRNFGFQLISENQPKSKKPRSENNRPSSSASPRPSSSASPVEELADSEAIMQMKKLIYRAAAFRPVSFSIEEEVQKRPKRKNVRISTDPQTVAARKRRERISERIRVLQKLVPGGSKMDTASMLDEAANYLKFLRTRVNAFEAFGFGCKIIDPVIIPFNYPFLMHPHFPLQNSNPVHRPKS